MRRPILYLYLLAVLTLPFYGGLTLGSGGGSTGDSQPQGYDQILQALLQQFPGLSSLSGQNQPGQSTGSLGFGAPGVNLYSGQPTSQGGLYGSTGTGIFEGASAGQPESVTGGLASGYLGKSASQAPLGNTGVPGSGGTASPGSPFGSLTAPSSFGFGAGADLSGQAQYDAGNLLGAPPQTYDLLGPTKAVVGGASGLYQAAQQSAQQQPGQEPGPPSQQAPNIGLGYNSFPTPFQMEAGSVSNIRPEPSSGVIMGDLNLEGGGGGGGGAPMGPAPGSTGSAFYDMLLNEVGLGPYAGQIGSGVGAGTGALDFVNAIQTGNPLGAAVSGLGAANNASELFGGPTLGSLASAALPAATQEALAQLLASVGGTAGLGMVSAGLLPIIQSMFGQDFSLPFSGSGRGPAQLHETNTIRRNFGTAWPQFQGAGDAMGALGGAMQGGDAQALQALIQQAETAQGALPAISQYLSTEGGRQSAGGTGIHIPAMDVSGYEQQSPILQMQAYLADLGARDKLAQLGSPYDETQAPQMQVYLNALGQQGQLGGRQFNTPTGAYQDPNSPDYLPPDQLAQMLQLTPEEAAGLSQPGQRLQTIQSAFGRLSPNYAGSPLALALQGLLPQLQGAVHAGNAALLQRMAPPQTQGSGLDWNLGNQGY